MKGCRGLISLTLLVCTFFGIVFGMPEPNDEISQFLRNGMISGGDQEVGQNVQELAPLLGDLSDQVYFETAQYTQMVTLLVFVGGILVVLTGIGWCVGFAIVSTK